MDVCNGLEGSTTSMISIRTSQCDSPGNPLWWSNYNWLNWMHWALSCSMYTELEKSGSSLSRSSYRFYDICECLWAHESSRFWFSGENSTWLVDLPLSNMLLLDLQWFKGQKGSCDFLVDPLIFLVFGSDVILISWYALKKDIDHLFNTSIRNM